MHFRGTRRRSWCCSWSGEGWQVYFDERAGIAGEMSITAQRLAERNAKEAKRRARLTELDREERNRAARIRRATKKAAAERERELSRLIGALGMLGSEHAGERAAAALLVERLRVKLGKQWRDLIRQ
jgi:hypothetical protein